jgi:hypothetical protein
MDERAAAANERIVDSLTLNDLEGTDLVRQLERIRHAHGDGPLRVGVVGVWTEAKVGFLLYDLKTRLGIDELATCSALTASASRAQHFNALAQPEKILGVHCFDSTAEFADWLRPGAELALPRHPLGFEPRIEVADARAALRPTDRAIVAHLFRDSTQVDLQPISGGYSGALAWGATSQDALGHRQAPAVVKLGPNRAIAQERVGFEQVEAVLGNNAPRVRGFVDLGDRAGLKYVYAAMGHGQVQTLQAMFAAEVATRRLISGVRRPIKGKRALGERIEVFVGLVGVGEEPGQQPQQRLVSEVEQLGDGAGDWLGRQRLRVGDIEGLAGKRPG